MEVDLRLMRTDRKNEIVELTFHFAIKVVAFAEKLEKQGKYVVAKQILRSGTAIGANVREAQNAESRADFIHKFKIAAKEADETAYWLALCEHAESYPTGEGLEKELIIIMKVISKIISTTKRAVK